MRSGPPRLSLAMITYNEADRVERALGSVPFADEIVVLDSGSTDDTTTRARRCGARVSVHPFDGFVAQRNRVLSLCAGEWVLFLDADEWLTARARVAVKAALSTSMSGYRLPVCSEWAGRFLRHGRWYPDLHLRLARRHQARWVGTNAREHLSVRGPVGVLPGDIGHAPYRSFQEHLQTIDRYSRLQARVMRADGVRGGNPLTHAGWAFLRGAVGQAGYRDGWRGLAVAGLGGMHSGLKHWRAR